MEVVPVPREVIEACAAGLLARTRARMEANARRADDLRARCREGARILRERYGVTRVWLFGSLAWGVAHGESDVDLLVEGLAAVDWAEALTVVERATAAAVDLLRIEEAPASLVSRVRADGVPLDEPR